MEKSPQKFQGKSSPLVHEFVAQWEQTFRRLERGGSGADNWFQGIAVFDELRKSFAGCLLMFPRRHGGSLDHFEAMMREILTFDDFVHEIQTSKVNHQAVIRRLSDYEKRLRNEQKFTPDKNLKKIWVHCAAFMRHQRITADRLLRRQWTLALESPTRTDWVRSDLTSHTSPMFPRWETIFSTARYPRRTGRITDLDARLQIRLAAILHYRFPTIARRTIARLVILSYRCGDLGTIKGTRLEVCGRGFLSVEAIHKRLKQAGI